MAYERNVLYARVCCLCMQAALECWCYQHNLPWIMQWRWFVWYVGRNAVAGSTVKIEHGACGVTGMGKSCYKVGNGATTAVAIDIGAGACSGARDPCMEMGAASTAITTINIGAGSMCWTCGFVSWTGTRRTSNRHWHRSRIVCWRSSVFTSSKGIHRHGGSYCGCRHLQSWQWMRWVWSVHSIQLHQPFSHHIMLACCANGGSGGLSNTQWVNVYPQYLPSHRTIMMILFNPIFEFPMIFER